MTALAALLTALTITFWPEGPDAGPKLTWTLRCNPPAGTLPRRAEACRRLARIPRPFAPVPADEVCTQIFGGPHVALVRGTFRGRRVWVRLNRRDGCQIARWNRVAFLFPGASRAVR